MAGEPATFLPRTDPASADTTTPRDFTRERGASPLPLDAGNCNARPMDINAVVGVAGALIAIIALWYSRQNVKVAKAQADAAVEQTEIQRQMHRDAAQPYIWVDVRADPSQGSTLVLIVGNTGQTTATNVRVVFDPPLPMGENGRPRVDEAQWRLRNGIKAIAPGSELWWSVGLAWEVITQKDTQPYRVTIDADGPFGPLETNTYTIDLADRSASRDEPDGTLHRLTKAVTAAGATVAAAVNHSMPAPPPATRPGGPALDDEYE